MAPGCNPREASDRLTIFQVRFDEIWSKYITYSGGEKLFGMTIREYPKLDRVRKELNLLQKLYQLYNSVLDTVDGYYEIPWADIDIDSINAEILDFQAK